MGDVSCVACVITTREAIGLGAAAAEVNEEASQFSLLERVEGAAHIGRFDRALESVEDEDQGRFGRARV
jgi:hypothetical protein